jgi:hypothetical protein
VKKFLVPFLFLIPLVALAHGTVFLEFLPSTTGSLNPNVAVPPSQILFPQNDFISGFDLFIANPFQSASLNVVFQDDVTKEILAERTVTVPVIPEEPGGKRFHIHLPEQIEISSSGRYAITLTTPLQDLQIYYGSRVYLLQHTEQFASDLLGGYVRLPSGDQSYSFKFTLYETQESVPPVVTGVVAEVISSSEARVYFNANEPVDSRVTYSYPGGPVQVQDFTGSYTTCSEGVVKCSVPLSIISGKTYQYVLRAKDTWGNYTEVSGTFSTDDGTTPPPSPPDDEGDDSEEDQGDVIAPVLTNARVVAVQDQFVQVAWHSNEAANSRLTVVLPTDPSKIITTVSDQTFELEHFLSTASVLMPETDYLGIVSSADPSGNISSTTIAFKTLAAPPGDEGDDSKEDGKTDDGATTTPGTPDDGSQDEVLPPIEVHDSDEGEGVEISWSPTIPAKDGYRIDIFDKNHKLIDQQFVNAETYKIIVKGLKPGTYYVVVYANNDGVFQKVGQPLFFSIQPAEENPLAWVFRIGFAAAFILVTGLFVWISRHFVKLRKRK